MSTWGQGTEQGKCPLQPHHLPHPSTVWERVTQPHPSRELKQRAVQPLDEPHFQIHDYIESQKKKSSCCAFS